MYELDQVRFLFLPIFEFIAKIFVLFLTDLFAEGNTQYFFKRLQALSPLAVKFSSLSTISETDYSAQTTGKFFVPFLL